MSKDAQYKNYNTWHRKVLGKLEPTNQNEFYRNWNEDGKLIEINFLSCI